MLINVIIHIIKNNKCICFRTSFKMISKDSILLYMTSAVIILSTVVYLYYKSIYSFWRNMGVFHIEPAFFFGNAKDRVLFKKSFHEFHRDMYFKFKGHPYAGKYVILIS